MPKLDKMFSNLKNLASMAAEHRPENPGDYLNLGAGLSSLLGRAHDAANAPGLANSPGYAKRFYDAAKNMLAGELKITPGAAMHEMPHELMNAYEEALATNKGINPSQRLLKGLAGVTGTTPAAYEAKQKAMTEALAAERSAADARRNLMLAGVGGAGLLGAAALMGRRAEDPDTYKHSSELGWQPRQKTAAGPFMTTIAPSETYPSPIDFAPTARPAAAPARGGAMGPPRPRFLGVSDADAIAAARNAAQYGNFGGARLAAGSRSGERQFTAAQARAFMERNPMAAQRSLGELRQGFQSQAPAPAAAQQVDSGLYRTLGQSRMPAAPALARAPGSMNMSLGQSRMPAPTRVPAGPVSRPQIPQSIAAGPQAYTQPATARTSSGYSIPSSYSLMPRQDVAASLANAFK